ncbi:MAG: YolA family protein [Marinisporobacter sp.]|jgi:hypothetical protein|nr:YolA family protein [Marinisporobacter sp.]
MKKITSLFLVVLLVLSLCSVSFAAPAPPLTKLGVYAVVSSNGGVEYIQPGQIGTQKDHGGSECYVVTYEIGFSSSKFAKWNSALLKEVHSRHIDTNNDGIVEGYLRWWDISGNDFGNFTYEAYSANYPWNKMSTGLRID